jgi:UPF0755 protein
MSEADEKGAPDKPTETGASRPPAEPAPPGAQTAAPADETAALEPEPRPAAPASSAPPIEAPAATPSAETRAASPPAPAPPIAPPPEPEPTPSPPIVSKVETSLSEAPIEPVAPPADIAALAARPPVAPSVSAKVEPPPADRPEPAAASSPPVGVAAAPAAPIESVAAPPAPPPISAKVETPRAEPPKASLPPAAEIAAPAPPSEVAPRAPASPAGSATATTAGPPPRAEAPPVGAPGPRYAATPDDAQTGSGIYRRRAALEGARQVLQPQAAPAPPPKKKKKRRDGTLSMASGFLSFILVALVAGAFGLVAATHKLKAPGPLAADKVVYIPPRSDLLEIIAQLEREGVIANSALMQLGLVLEGKLGKLKPGEYAFKKNISLRDVIDQIASGRQVMHSVTIPEGLTSEQIVQKLKEAELLAGDVADLPKEGALLPETYKFPRGYPRARLIAKMQEDQRKTLEAIWSKRAPDLPLRTPYELVTLASIVEKETGKVEERPRVAAVFVNRLRKGMRLQSDPTIIYGLVGGKATLGRPIMRAEIEKWTPYNTYAIDGLPPGPIANPGRAALEAAAHPAPTHDLYFVADGTGGHVFSDSLDQHSRNVQNWRRLEKEKNDESPDRAAPGVPAPAAPKPDKRTEAPIGRLVVLSERHEDYPPGGAMAADDGPTHRLGKFAYAEADFFLGGHGDRTQAYGAEFVRLRPARPFFTEESTQPPAKALFDASLLARRPPPSDAEDGEERLNPDMTTVARQSPDPQPDDGADPASYPVSPAQRAEQRARATRLGLAAGSDDLPETLSRSAAQDAAPPPEATALAPTGGRPFRPRAFDASEGTPLDPLRDKSWDLTSSKTIPSTGELR